MASLTVFALALAILIIFFGIFTTYATATTAEQRNLYYLYYPDVHIMTFLGFGFLMSFLSRTGFTATTHTLLAGVYTMLWAVLCRGFWFQALSTNDPFHKIGLNVETFLGANYCAVAILISFGAVIGRISAAQLLLMATLETFFYALNDLVAQVNYGVNDVGGSMTIHMFGAYFGLACGFMLNHQNGAQQKVRERGSGVSDTMTMIGTLLLFCFWPSFNAGLAGPNSADRAIVNTLLSICTSVLSVFIVTQLFFDGKFRMVELQSATLAGGVAIGASADMITTPYGAMIIGMGSGVIAVVSSVYVQRVLEGIGAHDTVGVHNLHGLPGFIGGLASVIIARTQELDDYGSTAEFLEVFPLRNASVTNAHSAATQSGYVLATMVTTLGIALVAGALTGFLCSLLPSLETFYDASSEYVVETVDPVHETEPTAN